MQKKIIGMWLKGKWTKTKQNKVTNTQNSHQSGSAQTFQEQKNGQNREENL